MEEKDDDAEEEEQDEGETIWEEEDEEEEETIEDEEEEKNDGAEDKEEEEENEQEEEEEKRRTNEARTLTVAPMHLWRRNSLASTAHGSAFLPCRSLPSRGPRMELRLTRRSVPLLTSATTSTSPLTTSTIFPVKQGLACMCCSPRHRMPCNSGNEDAKCIGWRE